jgi:hypothetical protein
MSLSSVIVKKISDRGSGSASKNKYCFDPKIVSKLSEIYSGIFTTDPDLDFIPITDHGYRGQKCTGSRIRNTGNWRPLAISDILCGSSSFSLFMGSLTVSGGHADL